MHPYRITLVRTMNEANLRRVLFVGVNPSIADVGVDDQTTKKLKVFAEKWGFHRYYLVNLFPYRATDINDLERYRNQRSRENRKGILKSLPKVELIVPMWGRLSKIPMHLRPELSQVQALLEESQIPMKCFGFTKCGQPLHPLMLNYDTELQEF